MKIHIDGLSFNPYSLREIKLHEPILKSILTYGWDDDWSKYHRVCVTKDLTIIDGNLRVFALRYLQKNNPEFFATILPTGTIEVEVLQ
jgi:hypothetical protein